MENINKGEGKNVLMVDCNILYIVLHKIKEIKGIKKIDGTKILIEKDNALPDDIVNYNF